MVTKLETFTQTQLKKDLPDIRPGDTVEFTKKLKKKTKKEFRPLKAWLLPESMAKEFLLQLR